MVAKNIAMIYIYDHHLCILRCQPTFTQWVTKWATYFKNRFSIFFHVLFGGRFNEIQIHHENLSDYSHYVWTCHIIHSSKCWFYANFKTIINFVWIYIWLQVNENLCAFDLYINWISKRMKTLFYNGEKGMMVVFFNNSFLG